MSFPFLFRYWLSCFLLSCKEQKQVVFTFKKKKKTISKAQIPESLWAKPVTSCFSGDIALCSKESWGLCCTAHQEFSKKGKASSETNVRNQSVLFTWRGFECPEECKARSFLCAVPSPPQIQKNVMFAAGETIALINCASVYASIPQTSECIPARPSARRKCCHTQLLGVSCTAWESQASLWEFHLLNGHNQRRSS